MPIYALQFKNRTKCSSASPRLPSRDSNEDNESDFDDLRDYMDQFIPTGQFPTAESGPIAQILTEMSDWMNMTPEILNLALEILRFPNLPLERPIELVRFHQDNHFKRPFGYFKGTIHTRDHVRTYDELVMYTIS
jgi:hypothetical protein